MSNENIKERIDFDNSINRFSKSKTAIDPSEQFEQFKFLPRFKVIVRLEEQQCDYEYELLSKAERWYIPYDKEDVDFVKLEDLVSEFESLMNRAEELSLYWDVSIYDPVGLEQAIEEAEELQYYQEQSLHRDYLSSRL